MFTKEDLCCDTRLTSLDSGSGISRKLTFSVKENDQVSGKSKTSIYIHDPDTLSNTRFTRPQNFGDPPVSNATVFEGDPRSPISEIVLFLRNGQVYCQPLKDGGEALQVTSTSVDISSFRIFETPALQPLLVVSMSIYPNMTPEETKAHDENVSKNTKSNAMVFDKLMVRHWDEWDIYKKRNHIFLLPLDITSESLLSSDPSKAIDLMKDIHSDCPMKPFGGVEDYCISPDGTKLAFVCRKYWTMLKTEPTDISWTTESYTHVVDITATLSQQTPSVTLLDLEDYKGSCALGSFSPDSERLALLKMKTDVYESDKTEIMICSARTGTGNSITQHIDLSFSSPIWSKDGQSIYALAQLRGAQRLIRLQVNDDREKNSISVFIGDASKGSFVLVNNVPSATPSSLRDAASHTDYLYYTESTITSPSEIKLAMLAPTDSTLFTDITELAKNPALSSEGQHTPVDGASFSHRYIRDIFSPCPKYTNGDLIMPSVEVHNFRGAANDIVHAFYLPPVTEQDKTPKSVPLVLLVHGGENFAIVTIIVILLIKDVEFNFQNSTNQIFRSAGSISEFMELSLESILLCITGLWSCNRQLPWFYRIWSKILRFYTRRLEWKAI